METWDRGVWGGRAGLCFSSCKALWPQLAHVKSGSCGCCCIRSRFKSPQALVSQWSSLDAMQLDELSKATLKLSWVFFNQRAFSLWERRWALLANKTLPWNCLSAALGLLQDAWKRYLRQRDSAEQVTERHHACFLRSCLWSSIANSTLQTLSTFPQVEAKVSPDSFPGSKQCLGCKPSVCSYGNAPLRRPSELSWPMSRDPKPATSCLKPI